MLVLIFIGVLLYFLYSLLWKSHKYWKNKNVPHERPLPLVGNLGSTIFRTRSFSDLLRYWYSTFPDARYVGFYQFYTPTLLIKNPDLVKLITVKEFDTFRDRSVFASENIDPLWAKNLAAMKGGARWQDMRSTLSPSFTSSKMKIMFELMRDCAKQFTDYFLKQGGTVTVEMKDAFTRFTNDVIGTTAFGVTCNSLENRENEFYLMGKDLTNFSGIRSLKFLLYTLSPTLMKALNVKIFSKSASDFFRELIQDTIKIRTEKNIIRPDMLHLLMEAKKGRLEYEESNSTEDQGFAVVNESEYGKSEKQQKPKITDEDITAQALIFFLGGFDTVSVLMTFASYELAINPDVQEKLRKEIDDTFEKHNGRLTYEGLMSMKYLDMVVTETLRKWPPSPVVDRVSVRSFTIEPQLPDESPITLEAGSKIWIAIDGMHNDPTYFPNPEKFDPERFSDEYKHKIKPFTYLPFGAGPRNCIASRFALLEGKLIIAEIISKFEIIPVENTEFPIKIDKTSFALKPKHGMWLGLKPR